MARPGCIFEAGRFSLGRVLTCRILIQASDGNHKCRRHDALRLLNFISRLGQLKAVEILGDGGGWTSFIEALCNVEMTPKHRQSRVRQTFSWWHHHW
jgi:hypothetical protein